MYDLPKIVRNKVKIMDMNILYRTDHIELLSKLRDIRVNGKIVKYELICGLDHRKITQTLAYILKNSRFENIRIAWDYHFKDQMKIKDCLNMFIKAGYKPKSLMVFIICNWKISYYECCQKLDLLKVWNVKVSDCWFDNETHPNITPKDWSMEECKSFRKKCRKHNQMVIFGIDPEVK